MTDIVSTVMRENGLTDSFFCIHGLHPHSFISHIIFFEYILYNSENDERENLIMQNDIIWNDSINNSFLWSILQPQELEKYTTTTTLTNLFKLITTHSPIISHPPTHLISISHTPTTHNCQFQFESIAESFWTSEILFNLQKTIL